MVTTKSMFDKKTQILNELKRELIILIEERIKDKIDEYNSMNVVKISPTITIRFSMSKYRFVLSNIIEKYKNAGWKILINSDNSDQALMSLS